MAESLEAIEKSFLKCGILFLKESSILGKKWVDHYVILHDTGLAWWKNIKDAKKNSYRKPKGAIVLKATGDIKLKEKSDDLKSFSFCLIVGKDTMHFSATSAEEMSQWCRPLEGILKGESVSKESLRAESELGKQGSSLNLAPETIVFSENIGSGASGIVRKGTWLKTTTVAVKMLKNLPEFTDKLELANFYSEVELLSKLRHLNIVQMYGYSKKDGYLCLVTEFVRDGSLSERIKSGVPIDLRKQVNLCQTICAGMVYLHSLGIIHRDLKPGNILIANWDEGVCKVCDFGLSGVVQSSMRESDTTHGSPQYAAPELTQPSHTHKVDVFSFAIILWEMSIGIYGVKFWTDIRFGSEFQERYAKDMRPAVPPDSLFLTLFEQTWATSPDLRLEFTDVFSELENLKAKLPKSTSSLNLNNNNNFSPNIESYSSPRSVGSVKTGNYALDSTSIEQIFDLFEGPTLAWPKFVSSSSLILGCPEEHVETLKYLLSDNNAIKRSTLEQFTQWFDPIIPSESMYQTNPNDITEGYTIENILEITDNTWFHGWLPTNKVQVALRGKTQGTFLFRFSTSNPGSFALSCSYQSTVGHWRISCENGIFFIEGRKYASLKDIIETHGEGKEGLAVKASKGVSEGSVNLLYPKKRKD